MESTVLFKERYRLTDRTLWERDGQAGHTQEEAEKEISRAQRLEVRTRQLAQGLGLSL